MPARLLLLCPGAKHRHVSHHKWRAVSTLVRLLNYSLFRVYYRPSGSATASPAATHSSSRGPAHTPHRVGHSAPPYCDKRLRLRPRARDWQSRERLGLPCRPACESGEEDRSSMSIHPLHTHGTRKSEQLTAHWAVPVVCPVVRTADKRTQTTGRGRLQSREALLVDRVFPRASQAHVCVCVCGVCGCLRTALCAEHMCPRTHTRTL